MEVNGALGYHKLYDLYYSILFIAELVHCFLIPSLLGPYGHSLITSATSYKKLSDTSDSPFYLRYLVIVASGMQRRSGSSGGTRNTNSFR